MSDRKVSDRGARIVKALEQFAEDVETGVAIEEKYTVRQVRVIPQPSAYTPSGVREVRERIGVSQEVFAQLLAVSPVTVRSWEQGARRPSAIARRFLDEIAMAPEHFRGRIVSAAEVGTERSGRSEAEQSRARRGR